MLLDIKKSKSGETIVVTDPAGEIHVVTDEKSLWATVNDLLADTAMPPMESEPAPPKRRAKPQVEDEYDDEEDEDGGFDLGDDAVADLAGRALTGLLGGLQRASFRGKKRRRRKPAEDAGDSG